MTLKLKIIKSQLPPPEEGGLFEKEFKNRPLERNSSPLKRCEFVFEGFFMNDVKLFGRIGKDAETQTIGSGDTTKTSFPLATSKTYKNRNGEKVEKTQWHNIEMWNKQGVAPYLLKGKQVLLEGSIDYQTWDKEDGSKGYRTVINCYNVTLVGGGDNSNNSSTQTNDHNSQPEPAYSAPNQGYPDELPF